MTKNMKEVVTLTCRVPKKLADHLRRIAISMSKQEGRVISVSEFIRSTMMQFMPQSEQLDMFENEKKKRLRRSSQKTI